MSTVNSIELQSLDIPSRFNHSRIIKGPKPLRTKLQRILEAQISAVIGSETEFSQGHKNCNNNLRSLFSRFESYYNIVRDGNEIFRIVGIHHLQHILHKPEVLEEHCNNFLKSSIQANVLTDIPSQYKKQCNKDKIVEILKVLLLGLEKSKPNLGFYKSIAALLNNHRILDFALVSFYRLYTYMFGYLSNESIDDMRLEESLLLGYGKEVDSESIHIICQCFSLKVDLYEVSGTIIELTCYEHVLPSIAEPNIEGENQLLYFSIKKHHRQYSLLEEKSEAKLKEDEHILAGWRQDLTLSEIALKKNPSSEFYLTDQKQSLWDGEIEGPISPVQADNRPRRYTQKIGRIDEMSISFLNQFGIIPESNKDKQHTQQPNQKRAQTKSNIKPKQYYNMKISEVLSERVSPRKSFPSMKNEISQEDIDAMTSGKGDSVAGNKSQSRISSKAGTIKKQTVISQSMRSGRKDVYLEDEKNIDMEYYRMTQNQKKEIVTEYLKGRMYDQTQNHYQSAHHYRIGEPSLASSKSIIIEADGLEIKITKN